MIAGKTSKLKVWELHAGVPFLKETISIINTNWQLFTAMFGINNTDIVTAKKFKIVINALWKLGLKTGCN